MSNQDLMRSSVNDINPQVIQNVLNWVLGNGELPLPKSIHLNLTLRCTAKCLHCHQWSWPSHNELSITQLGKLFFIFNSWGVKSVTLGGGNPLLHPDIIDTLYLSSSMGIDSSIITEGGDIADNLLTAICTNVKWIRFSLDGPTPEIHDLIRNSDGLFEKVITNIKQIKQRNFDLPVGVNCVIQRKNFKQLQEMIQLCDDLSVDYLLFKIPHGDDSLHKYIPTSDEWAYIIKWIEDFETINSKVKHNLSELKLLLQQVYQSDDLVKGKPTKSFYVNHMIKCFTPLLFLTCDSEGYAYPCDYLQGDTRHWKGKYQVMRNEFCLGNILTDTDEVIRNLKETTLGNILNLPNSGYEECGSCTRFCQLNYSMSSILENYKQNSYLFDKFDFDSSMPNFL